MRELDWVIKTSLSLSSVHWTPAMTVRHSPHWGCHQISSAHYFGIAVLGALGNSHSADHSMWYSDHLVSIASRHSRTLPRPQHLWVGSPNPAKPLWVGSPQPLRVGSSSSHFAHGRTEAQRHWEVVVQESRESLQAQIPLRCARFCLSAVSHLL